MEDQWLGRAKRLQALASTGLGYTESDFDRERYEEIAQIAAQMLADIGNVPIQRINDLIADFAEGYATPKIDVRGAVIRDDTILLVREKVDGKWTLPGGFADVGLSAATNVVKEVGEEACLNVEARMLYGIFHKAAHDYDADTRDFYKFYFLCVQTEPGEPSAGMECLDAAFFQRDDLPELSTGRVIDEHIQMAFSAMDHPEEYPKFD